MSTIRIVAIVLIVLGAVGLITGGIRMGGTTHEVKMGPMEMSVTEERTLNVPLWAGIASIVVGGALLLSPRGKLGGS